MSMPLYYIYDIANDEDQQLNEQIIIGNWPKFFLFGSLPFFV